MLLSTYEKRADDKEYITLNLHKNGVKTRQLPHFHNSVEFMLMRSGECRLRINAEERILREGEGAFIGSFDVHHYIPSKDCEYYYVLISSDFFDGTNKLKDISFPRFLSSSGTSEIIEFLDYVYPRWEGGDSLFKTGFVNMFLGLVIKSFPARDKEKDERIEAVGEALRFINENFKEDISLSSVAEHFGYTPNYFSSLFNKFTGMNFREYLNRCRIVEFDRIKKEDTKLSVSSAARECGFQSLNTFYRAYNEFKK